MVVNVVVVAVCVCELQHWVDNDGDAGGCLTRPVLAVSKPSKAAYSSALWAHTHSMIILVVTVRAISRCMEAWI